MVDINALQADGPTAGVLQHRADHRQMGGLRMVRPAASTATTSTRCWPRSTPSPAGATRSGTPSVILCDTKVGRGVPLLENREKAHFMRIDADEWQICRDQLTAGYKEDEQHEYRAPLRTSAMIASFADPGQKTTPAPFGHALVAAAQADERIVGLTADLGKYTDMHIFAQAFPERFFQMGMAEQLLFGAAAGMAETGLVPFASTYSVFAARRAYDFICLDIAEPGLNVNIVGGLPGLTTGYGPSHQATEDMAIFRGIPGLTIVDPCDSVDIEQAVPQLAASTPARPICGYCAGTCRPCSTSTTTPSNSARPRCCATAPTWSSMSCGLMTMRALQAADELADDNVDVAVVHTPTIKPFDAETVLRRSIRTD